MKSLWLHHPSNPLLNPEVLLAKQHLLFTETSLTVFAFLFRWSFCCSKEAWSIPDIFSPASWYILVSVFHLKFKRNNMAYRRLEFPYWNFVLWTCIFYLWKLFILQFSDWIIGICHEALRIQDCVPTKYFLDRHYLLIYFFKSRVFSNPLDPPTMPVSFLVLQGTHLKNDCGFLPIFTIKVCEIKARTFSAEPSQLPYTTHAAPLFLQQAPPTQSKQIRRQRVALSPVTMQVSLRIAKPQRLSDMTSCREDAETIPVNLTRRSRNQLRCLEEA